MDLPDGLENKIDEYVSDALDSTGTRKSRRRVELPLPADRVPRASSPEVVAAAVEDIEIDVSDMAAEEPSDGLLPVEIDESTDPGEMNVFSFDEGTAWLAPAYVAPVDPIPTLSRIRTARGTPPPPAEIEVDDEITNVVKTKPAPKC